MTVQALAATENVLVAPATADLDVLRARFQPVFDQIAEGNVARERERVFPYEQVKLLIDADFGLLRIPENRGGFGASLQQTFILLSDLAKADPNVAHVWRNHLAFVEDRIAGSVLSQTKPEITELWLQRFRDGEFVGGGWTEANNGTFGNLKTVLSEQEDGSWRITGNKFYATGSLYADWLDVLGRSESGEILTALVKRDQPGVTLTDDWTGFGQQTTSSGSASYTDAVVQAEDLFPARQRFIYQGLFYQAALLSVLAGITRAVERDGVIALKARKRSYAHGLAQVPSEDPQLLQVIGQLSALRFTAESVLERAVASLDTVALAHASGDAAFEKQALIDSTVEITNAQLALIDVSLRASTLVFDALGASGVFAEALLDRHWRNARTISSHNPRVYKERILGGYLVNEDDPSDRFAELLASSGGQGQA